MVKELVEGKLKFPFYRCIRPNNIKNEMDAVSCYSKEDK